MEVTVVDKEVEGAAQTLSSLQQQAAVLLLLLLLLLLFPMLLQEESEGDNSISGQSLVSFNSFAVVVVVRGRALSAS